jgi:putative transposase
MGRRTIMVKRHRHTPAQVVRKLREGERLLNQGKDLTEVLRSLEISEPTWHRWRAQDGGLKASQAKRLRDPEAHNARLNKLVANQALAIDMLKELAEGTC